MTVGRKPKPTALKLIQGNPGRRPLPAAEVKPPEVPKLPPAPEHLNALGREEWRIMGRRLMALGLLTIIDTSVFTLYCEAWGDWAEITDQMLALAARDPQMSGRVIRDKEGKLYTNPLWRMKRQAKADAHRLASDFGMTPSARARLGVVVSPGATDSPATPDGTQKTGTDRFFAR